MPIHVRNLKDHWLYVAIFIWIFLAMNEVYWLRIDNFPLIWDSALHFVNSVQTFKILNEGFSSLSQVIHVHGYYPPLVPLTAAPFYALFDIDPDVGIAGMNLVFLGILILSIFGIGKIMANGMVGALSAFIVAMYPAIFGYSRTFMYDIPLMAMVTLGLYMLLKTENFKHRKYSLLFGLVLGLGMLTKWTYALFIIGPICFVLYRAIKSHGLKSFIVTNIISSIIIATVLSALWYGPNISVIYSLRYYVQQNVNAPPYSISLIYHMSFLLFAISIVALIYIILSNKTDQYVLFLIIWIGVPFILFSLQEHQEPRYIAPILPAFALISAIGIDTAKNKKIKSILIASITILSLFQFFSCSYGQGFKELPDNTELKIGSYPIEIIGTFIRYDYPYIHGATVDDWETDKILDTILKDDNQRTISVCLIPYNPMIMSPLWYMTFLNKNQININLAGLKPCDVMANDYILTYEIGTGYWGSEDVVFNSTCTQKEFEKSIDNFALINTIILPDDSELLIFKNINPSPNYSIWYDFENWGGTQTRWMAGDATTHINSPENRTAKLSFQSISYHHNRSLVCV